MIVILKEHAREEDIRALCRSLEEEGLSIHNSEGAHTHILGSSATPPAWMWTRCWPAPPSRTSSA